MKNRYKRQIDIVDEEKLKFPIHIIGSGGIGSWTALLLAKMGCSDITIYDDDEVEDHNVASQFFMESDIGKNKCLATQMNVDSFSGGNIKYLDQEKEEDIQNGMVIFAVDSAEERIRLGKIYEKRNIFIIDGRMGGLQAEVYCRLSKDYMPITVAPEDADPDPCTGRAISFNCAFIASMIANYVRLYANEKLDLEAKDNQLIFLFDNFKLLK